jgi:hypothetical protein
LLASCKVFYIAPSKSAETVERDRCSRQHTCEDAGVGGMDAGLAE